MASCLTKIVILSPSFFAFLSGVAMSITTKLVVGLAIEGYVEEYGWLILVPTILFAMGGVVLISFSWALTEPHQKWRAINRGLDWDEDEIRSIAIGDKTFLLWILLFLGSSAFLGGFVFLFISGAK